MIQFTQERSTNIKKTRMLITCSILTAALSQMPAMANDYDIVTMEKVAANELMLIPAQDLKVVPSNEVNYFTRDNIELLAVTRIEEFGGALQFESNLFATTDYSEPIEKQSTLDAVSGEVDNGRSLRNESAVPFRWRS